MIEPARLLEEEHAVTAPTATRGRSHLSALALALLALYAVLLCTSMADESPTTDEPVHLTRGLAYFWAPDTSLSWAHPPLGNLLSVLPIVLTSERVDVGSFPSFASGDVGPVAEQLLSTDYAQRRAWFFQARAMVAGLAWLLAFYVYRLSARLYGPLVAVWALGFFVLHPTLIGLGRTLTTDMPVTLAMIVATGELATFLRGGSRWRGVAAAAAVGAAIATKFSALILIPLAAIAVLGFAVFRLGRYRGAALTTSIWAACAYLGFTAALSLFAINAAYRFERTGVTAAEMLRLPEPTRGESRKLDGNLLEEASLLPRLPAWMPIPLPFTYVFGLSYLAAHNESGHSSVFMGKTMRHGHPAYFPTLLLIKTPIVMLAALCWAGYVGIRGRKRVGVATALLGGYAIVFLLLAMRAGINIGIRHILPMIPILPIFAAWGAAQAYKALQGVRLRPWLVGAAVCGGLIGVAWSYPDYISDFNLLVGGRRGGERISIIGEEWGQDVQRLGRALRERGIRDVYFSGDSYISRLELARHDVASQALDCRPRLPDDAIIAVRARERTRGRCYQWSRKRKPWFDVAGHIFVYRTDAREPPL